MANLPEDSDRQTVPRWRSFGSSVQLGELAASSTHELRSFDSQVLQHILADWRQEPGLSTACDLVCTAFSVG